MSDEQAMHWLWVAVCLAPFVGLALYGVALWWLSRRPPRPTIGVDRGEEGGDRTGVVVKDHYGDTIRVLDFECDEETGLPCKVRAERIKGTLRPVGQDQPKVTWREAMQGKPPAPGHVRFHYVPPLRITEDMLAQMDALERSRDESKPPAQGQAGEGQGQGEGGG